MSEPPTPPGEAKTTAYGWSVIAARPPITKQIVYDRHLLSRPAGLIARIDPALAARIADRRSLVFLDGGADDHQGAKIRPFLARQCGRLTIYRLDLTPAQKTTDTVASLYPVVLDSKFARDDVIWAIGGGVVLDVVGAAAAQWNKGALMVSWPTTVNALVDAGPASKRTVDLHTHGGGWYRNLIGSYYAPCLMLATPEVVTTTDSRDVTGGACEALKAGLVGNRTVVRLLDRYGPALALHHFDVTHPRYGRAADQVLRLALEVHVRMLAVNELELPLPGRGRQRLLDHGHEFAHMLEVASLGRLVHGMAVGYNLLWAACVSALRGWCPPELPRMVARILHKLGVPLDDPALTPELVIGGLRYAEGHRGDQHVALVTTPGHVRFACHADRTQISDAEAVAALTLLTDLAAAA